MTEIITDYLDAKQLADRLTALELHSTSELARLERERDEANEELHKQLVQFDQLFDEAEKIRIERDEAREKVEQQRKEIVRLNGATNHAGGTPLKIALRERDQWAEMCGRYKQERDEAREQAQQMSESNQLLMADVRFYRNALEETK